MQSLESFYADKRRTGSHEIRFGAGWRTPRFDSFEFAIFWVEETQELCALGSPVTGLLSDGPITRFVLGIPPHTRPHPAEDDELFVEILTRLDEERLWAVMSDWEDHYRESDGLDWIRSVVPPLEQ